jgi:hypothetical protein
MSILETEPVKGFINRILPVGILSHPYDGMEEYIDVALERSNTECAEMLALRVRDNGIQRFGQTWAEYDGLLTDGRRVALQASEEVFVVNISGRGGIDFNEHAVWDRKQKIMNVLEIRDPGHNNQQVMYFDHFPNSKRIPKELSLLNVSRIFASMLVLLGDAGYPPPQGI